ncbi:MULTISPECIES: siderophore-interacting protein [Streptomyces]|uniref:siderophore-interacting protein n=1 Tax=Streptomyces TaxID=1883 RepID=UPI000BB0D344|nr:MULTISPECIES: siderophore-interacting protein [Streptomyces]MCX4432613.1 siderophore-interacting protein [Streptomyces mirabilis]PBD00301.1 NADPH-dependent ferric siderophore reductase [Streptomyces sp. Ag82_O1-15]SOE77188.1 NADPH-dependent ferric siderophore reductase, contains FAD-binding and SIP domains [Streptomyces sp. OV198]
MAERPARRSRKPHSAHVVRTERLTPHMQRVVLGGEGLAEFTAGTSTDHYVKLLFAPEGVTYPEPFDVERIREELPREQWPVTRTYTVRAWDPELRELTLDFVVHGDEGLAGPWAAHVQPGEVVRFMGPGGAYAPDAGADWHLLAGDESALPAISAALEALPEGAVARAFVEISGREEEQKIDSDVEVVWLHRGDRPLGEALVEAVRALDFPAGRVHAFVHGEAGFVKELRRLLRVEREIPREDLSISGYWRLGHNEDGWQASKRDWNAQVEAEQEATASAAS